MKLIAMLLAGFGTVFSLQAGIVEKEVEYELDGVTMEGFHAYDDEADGKRPGVLIIHQWTGLTDYEKMRARMLAELGYNVFAADVYGAGIRPQPPEAGEVSGKYKADRELYRARMQAGLEVLKADWQLVMYGGAVHAFTQKMAGDDISKGAAYDAKADERSWEDMRQFFAEIFSES